MAPAMDPPLLLFVADDRRPVGAVEFAVQKPPLLAGVCVGVGGTICSMLLIMDPPLFAPVGVDDGGTAEAMKLVVLVILDIPVGAD
jgi:hypothetical protein